MVILVPFATLASWWDFEHNCLWRQYEIKILIFLVYTIIFIYQKFQDTLHSVLLHLVTLMRTEMSKQLSADSVKTNFALNSSIKPIRAKIYLFIYIPQGKRLCSKFSPYVRWCYGYVRTHTSVIWETKEKTMEMLQ